MIPDLTHRLDSLDQVLFTFKDDLNIIKTNTQTLKDNIAQVADKANLMKKDINFLKQCATEVKLDRANINTMSVKNSVFRNLAIIVLVALAIFLSILYIPEYSNFATIGGLFACIIPLFSIAEDTKDYFFK